MLVVAAERIVVAVDSLAKTAISLLIVLSELEEDVSGDLALVVKTIALELPAHIDHLCLHSTSLDESLLGVRVLLEFPVGALHILLEVNSAQQHESAHIFYLEF